MNKLLILLLIVSVAFACQNSKEHYTSSGMKYILHTAGTGKQPAIGDYVTIDLVCHTQDTVLLDTRKFGSPYRLRLEKLPFAGCYEEGLSYLKVGDSATFYVSADSLYKQLFGGLSDSFPQEKTFLKKGSFVLYDVKLLQVQDYVTAEQEMEMKYSKLEKQEKKFLEEFIQRNKISAIPDSSGIYTIYSQHGTGAIADTGKVLTLFFRGRLLDGKVFMASPKDKPYQFVLGRKEVIEGWEHALHQVRVGDRLTLIVPSRYGYGQQGLMNNSDQQFLVPPYSTLIFDIVVAGVDDLSTASK